MAVATPRRVRRLLKHTPWSPGGRGEGVGVAVAVIVIAGAVVGSTSFTVVGDRPSTDTGRSVPTLLPLSLPSLSASPVFAAADPAPSSRRGEEEEVLPHLRGEEKTAHRSLAALHGANPRARLDELEHLVEGLIENVRPRLQRWVLVVVQLMAGASCFGESSAPPCDLVDLAHQIHYRSDNGKQPLSCLRTCFV